MSVCTAFSVAVPCFALRLTFFPVGVSSRQRRMSPFTTARERLMT